MLWVPLRHQHRVVGPGDGVPVVAPQPPADVLHAADPQQGRPGERFESQRSRSLAMPLDPPDPESRAQENGEPENRAPASASQDSDLDHGDPRSIPEERAEEFAQASDEIRPPTSMALQLIPLSDVFAANPSHLTTVIR